MSSVQPVRSTDRLTAGEIASVLELADAAGAADGVHPLSEDVVLRVRAAEDGVPGARHHLIFSADGLAGYAFLDHADPDLPSGELVVRPEARRRGHGTALLAAIGPGPARFWAHGDEPAAQAFAAKHGFTRTRVLWQMRRTLTGDLPDVPLPAGVTLRHFRPGHDEAAWLGVNARAFADHPEQGRWQQADLAARLEEPWFDANGFFVAEKDGRFIGYHWTKVHEPPVRGEPAGTRAGEVYVLGLDPDAQAGGLGKALLVAGLDSLKRRGLPVVMLYAESDNHKAIKLYEKLGFDHVDTDVRYRHPGIASVS